MRAFHKIEQFDIVGHPKAWLTSILRNIHIDRARVRADAILTAAQGLDSVTTPAATFQFEHDPQDVATILEQFSDQVIIDALHLLPEEIRWTLLLIDIEQMSYDEAANVLDVPNGTIKSRVHRGHQMLHERLLGRTKTSGAANDPG